MRRGAALATLGAAALTARALPAKAQGATTLRVGASLDDGLTPLLYALDAGLFAKRGLDVRLQSSTSGAALAAAVAGGGVDVAKSSLMALISAYVRGVRFKLVAGAALYTSRYPTDQLAVLKTSPIRSPGATNGKTIVVNALKSLDQLAVDAIVDKDGGDSSTLQFIELPFSAMFPALEQGRADVASIGNPNLAVAFATGKLRLLGDPYEGIAPRFLIAGWFSTAQFARENAATVRSFADAMREATAFTNAHHDATVPIVARYAHIDPAVVRKMNRLTNALTLQPNEIQPSIDAAVKYRFIDRGFSAEELLL